MKEKLEIRAMSALWRRGIEFMAISGGHCGKPIVMEPMSETCHHEPTFVLSMDEAQALMDDLWHCGLRPTEGTGSAGAMAATQKHLEDMRRLVFDKKE